MRATNTENKISRPIRRAGACAREKKEEGGEQRQTETNNKGEGEGEKPSDKWGQRKGIWAEWKLEDFLRLFVCFAGLKSCFMCSPWGV